VKESNTNVTEVGENQIKQVGSAISINALMQVK
jgi:hypothetical protein